MAIVAVLIGVLVSVYPVRNIPLGEVDAFIPVVDGMMLLGEIITATLLFAQAGVFRSRALIVLGTGYLFTALLLIPHALTFPGAFAPDGLLGAGVNTTAWIAISRRLGFPVAIILYAYLKSREPRTHLEPSARAVIAAIVAAAVAALAITVITTVGHDLLPPYYATRSALIYSSAVIVQAATALAFFASAVVLFRNRSSVLDLWLLVAVAGWLIETLLIITLQARFTVGFYTLYVMVLFSHLVVMLALIAETNRLYARLAVSTALRHEERDARLMSMDAVAAAISHGVGQPVAAANMSAAAALEWLDREGPDVAMATTSLRSAIESGRDAFAVIKDMRTMFDSENAAATTFDLNLLARETARLVEGEAAARKIALALELGAALPSVVGDRVLIQRVLLSLLTNAIASIDAARSKSREIEIRSRAVEGDEVLLEVCDSGTGIAQEDLPHLFNAFLATRTHGSGLGMSLCRAIVEEHGGKLWASRRTDKQGAIFHLQLPRSGRSQGR